MEGALRIAMDGIRLIPLSGGQAYAIVDADVYDELSQYTWHLHGKYAARKLPHKNGEKQITVLMHRVVARMPDGMMTDHINGITIDNRRCNLRPATMSGNVRNRFLSRRNTTGYKGVSFCKRDKVYLATIRVNNYQHCLGYFKNPRDAAAAYNEAALRFYGEYARINDLDNPGHEFQGVLPPAVAERLVMHTDGTKG